MNQDENDFWNSSSVSSGIMSNFNNNDNDNDNYIYNHYTSNNNSNDKSNDDYRNKYEIKKIILPNLGYSNENKSFIFKFSTNLREINGFSIPRIINIKLLNLYNFYIDDMYLNITPLKYEHYDGLVVEIKLLKSRNIPNDLLLSLYAKKIELYLLELPIDDEIYLNLGITVKKENIGHFCTINKNKNKGKKYAIDNLINTQQYDNDDDDDNF
jgi:hypothetical protein